MKTYRTVKLALFDKEHDVLVLRRSETHPTQAMHYDLPGGILEEGEGPDVCLSRELKEETTLEVKPSALKLFFAKTEKFDDQNAVRLVFAAQLASSEPEVKLSWEHDQYKWLSLDEAVKSQSEGRYTREALEYLQKHKILKDL